MAKLRTIDAIRTSVQSIKKYIDSKLPNINIKQDVVRAFDVSGQLEEEWYPEFVTDTLGLIPNVEYKIIVSVDGVPYHGRFTPKLYDSGAVGVVNFVEDGIENIFFDEVNDADDYFNYNVPRCLGFINLFDKLVSGPNGEEVFDETKATIHFSVGEYEDGTIEKITGVEIFIPDEQNVLLTGEVVQQELDKKQDKLTYKESTAKSHKIEINGQPGELMEQCGFVSEALNLVPGKFYTIKMKVYEVPMPSSVDVNSEEAKPYNVATPFIDSSDINPEDFTCEVDLNENMITYRMPAVFIPGQETGFDVDMTMLSVQFMDGVPDGGIDFVIYDKLTVDESDMPIYSEDKSLFLLSYYGFASLIEYVEIIPDVSSEDMVEVEVNNEFLETHRFITEEERKRWNEKQDVISDAFHLRKIPQIDNSDRSARVIRDRVDLIRNMTDGLYVATYDIYFYGESEYVDITLGDGIEDAEFPIYKNDIIQFISIGNTVEFCGIVNYSSGKACVLDVDAGIVWIRSATGAYLGNIEEAFQYECVEQGVTYTKAEHVTNTMNGGTSYREYQIDEDFVIERDKKYHVRFVGSNGQVQEFIEKSYYDTELYGNPVYEVYANSISVRTYKSSDGSNIIKVKVYNSLGIPDMDSITINEIAYLSSEFFDEYRFVTKEEKQKYETAYNHSQITQSEFETIVNEVFNTDK